MMHITVPRVLGFLLFLALIGYAFFLGPRLNASARPGPVGATHSSPASPAAPRATAGPGAPDTSPSALSHSE